MKTTLSLTLLLSLALTAGAADSGSPNIVLIVSDDQSYTDYSFMGHPAIETPHLDKLASQGTVFRHGYVPTALCRPALMTLATGLYAHQNRTTGKQPGQHARQRIPRGEGGRRHQGSSHLPHRRNRRPAPVAGKEGIRQSPKRQVVGRALQSRRLHGGYDPRIPEQRWTAWRRGAKDRA